MTFLEIAANAVTALSIVLAARNHVHTWTTGIAGCVLFGLQFFQSQLYADAMLQLFFIVTSAIGWWQWRHADDAAATRPISRVRPAALWWMVLAAVLVTLAYGALLHRYTDAWAPYADSAVLAFSVVAQCLLMQRKLETWAVWLVVNTLSVPLFASRGLTLTALLYAAYWCNAWYGGWRWWREWHQMGQQPAPSRPRSGVDHPLDDQGLRSLPLHVQGAGRLPSEQRAGERSAALPSRPAVPSGDRPMVASDEGPT